MDATRRAEKQRLLAEAARRAGAYLDRDAEAPVFPSAESEAALDGLTDRLSDDGSDAMDVLAQLDRLGSPATVRTNGGRYFGFVNGGSEPEALAANVLASVWDQNAALPVMSPVAARLDEIASRWIVEILGLPAAATGGFCAGAAVANLTCVVAARDALLMRDGWDVAERGLVGAPPLQIVASEEIHIAVLKALRVAGLGTGSVTFVPTDDEGRVRADALPPLGPRALVLLQAGNVNTGHSDPFPAAADATSAAGGWLHIDGAFGLWAAASPTRRRLVAGAERADSWAVDAHKWLNVPYDSALAVCARGEDLRRSMAMNAAYLPADAARASMHLGLQMSQRARAVDTWAVLATKGRRGVAEMIDHTCELAARMADALRAEGVQLLAEPVLNQVLVAFRDDATTLATIAAVQDGRRAWVGGTVWKGRQAMRISCSDTMATTVDVDDAVDAILRAWRSVEVQADE
ncbi:MAG: pyridoxal-dependent decarboxylase [Acidimicrobiales bacterium]